MFRSFLSAVAIAVLCLLSAAPPVQAQQNNLQLGALITNTARVPGTVSALGRRNDAGNGLSCTLSQASEVGNPSTIIKIEAEDSASGTWQELARSAALTGGSGTGSVTVQVYPGAVATSVPSGMAVAGLKVPPVWRVTQVITGGTSATGTVGCDLLN